MDFVTVAAYDTMTPAHIAMGRLQAEGIECWLADENLVQMDWLYSIAVGGIKLQVHQQYAHWAAEILATDYSAELSDLDDEET